jgi:hypothetical protein
MPTTLLLAPTVLPTALQNIIQLRNLLNKSIFLNRYFDDKKKIEQVRGIFTGLSSVDNDEQGNKAVAAAMANPERYVLKPQREGGGNNIYGQDIPPFLSNIADANERNAYILMDRINPPITTNYVVRPGKSEAEMVKVVSELGIFGYVIG